MIFTDYYRFEKLPNQKSKLRIDCTSSTGSYDPLEMLRNKTRELFIYIGDNTHTKAGEQRKAGLALSKSTHISSIYNPDLELPYWYGDMKGTADAFIFVHRDAKFIEGKIQPGAIVEVFIARGQRNNREALYNAVCEGEYNDEMQGLRKRVTKSVTATDEGVS